ARPRAPGADRDDRPVHGSSGKRGQGLRGSARGRDAMTGRTQDRYPCDMHRHTVRSDGKDTPQELIDNAALLGLHAVAITDHDVPPPLQLDLADGRRVQSVDYAAGRGVRLILGYEFSCD